MATEVTLGGKGLFGARNGSVALGPKPHINGLNKLTDVAASEKRYTMSTFCVGSAPIHQRKSPSSIWGCVAVVALGLCSANPASAQSAADKATARQLATQGIQQYQQGKNAEALDLLQKAEQLYDAPIHLIYIARAQAALGKLVEASETYRRLARIDLPAGAPQAFKDAVSDAHKELPQLEPRIPSLRIDVIPSEAEGLKLKIDGEQLSSVVIGINRPTNPGRHLVEVVANGYESASSSVDLALGGKQTVSLRMKRKAGVAVSVGETEAGAPLSTVGPESSSGSSEQKGASGYAPGKTKSAPDVPFDRGSQLVVGARGVLASPGGTLRLGGQDTQSIDLNGADADKHAITDASAKDRFKPGGGFEIHAGYRFALGRQVALTPLLTFQSTWFDKGDYYSHSVSSVVQHYVIPAGNSTNVLQITPTEGQVSLSAAFEYPMPSNTWIPSGYAELGLIVYDQLKASGTLTTGISSCKISDAFSGRGVKLGLGALLPANKVFRFNAGIGYQGILTTARDYSDTCQRDTNTTGFNYSGTFAGSDQKVHSLVIAAIGGDLMIGL